MKLNFYYLVVFSILNSTSYSHAQSAGDRIFDNSILHEVHFEFTQTNFWDTLTNNYETTPEGDPVPYFMGKVTIDGETVDSVGVRLKGFTSYTFESDKKPFKIDFNEFVKGKKYDGLKKLNLNNGTGDPSMQRDVLCYDLLRNSGVKAPRTSYSKVYLNGKYWGLYQNIEQVDKIFLKQNFANGKGNLFKNKGWSKMEWEGTNPNLYHPPFELKTNEEGDDWNGFVNFLDVLNNSSDTDFPTAIEKIFNVNSFLKILAVDVATNNWDSYLEHGRNWYIYEDTTTGIFNWIPWDYNFALQEGTGVEEEGVIGGGEEGECNLFPNFIEKTNGTTTVAFYDGSFYTDSIEYLWDFGDSTNSKEQNPIHIYAMEGTYNVCLTISSSSTCSQQICSIINTAFIIPQCQSIINGSSPHPANFKFQIVITQTPSCCDNWNQECEDFYNDLSIGSANFSITNFTINQQENERILIKRLLNVPEFNNRYYTYFCDLLDNKMTKDYLFDLIDHNEVLISDAIKSDSNFLSSFEDFKIDISSISDTLGIKSILSKRIDSLQMDLDTLFSCSSSATPIAWNDIVINEFIASTDSTSIIKDSNAEIEDWIELFNNTSNDIDLSEVYFSDKIADLQKWQFPLGTIIPAKGYLIIWADKDEEQDGLHSNFKLKKTGEQLVLSNSIGSIIDSLTFGEQTVNIASARIPNGTGDFIFQKTTHNFNNEATTSVFNKERNIKVNIYPNPATNYLIINIQDEAFSEYQVSVFTINGKQILTKKQNSSSFRLNLNNWNDGFYILQIVDKFGQINISKFIIQN